MNLTGKLVISLIVAAIASTITTLLQGDEFPDLALIAGFTVATLLTAALTSLPGQASPGQSREADTSRPKADGPAAGQEQGKVKWFNVSKGFGFIIKDDGEEIFVHFRSIRGEGRRSLRDGQRVAFTVADSDKGPQAEDVVALD